MSPLPALTIVAALRDELQAVSTAIPPAELHRARLIRSGVGPESAARAVAEANVPKWGRICSTGFCGGLADGLNVGDIVVATEILHGGSDKRIAIDAATVKRAVEALQSAGMKFHVGPLVSVPLPVFRCDDKRALGQKTQAAAVDMESYAIAAPGGASPFVLRVISDAVTDELPAEVSEFLDADGNVRAGKITKFIIKRPANIARLMELKKRSDTAAAALTTAWKAVWPVLAELEGK
jgi:nucleoside phosphorylase